MQARHSSLATAGVLAVQALGVAIWWEWFNGFAGGQSLVGTGILKFILIYALLGWWSYWLPRSAEKRFAWPADEFRWQDARAGLPLACLPLLIPITPLLVMAAKHFPMKSTALVWMPWWINVSKVLKPEAYAALAAAGVLIMAAAVWKAVTTVMRLSATEEERRTPLRLFVVGFLACLLLLSWPAIVSGPHNGELAQWLVTQALGADGWLWINNVLGRGDFRIYHPAPQILFQGYTDSQGLLYLPVAPGIPLLLLAFFLIQGRWLMAVLGMVMAAGTAAQIYGFCRDRGYSGQASFGVWVALLTNAPLMLYGYMQYEVVFAAFFLAWGMRMAFRSGDADPKPAMLASAMAGLAGGLLWLADIRFVLLSLVILAVVLATNLVKHRRLKHLGTFTAVAAVPVAASLLYYSTVYPLFILNPVYNYNLPWHPGFLSNALAVFSDRYAGVALAAPLWLLGLAGIVAAGKGQRPLSLAVLGMLAMCLLFAMVFADPHADGTSYHRYLAPVVPLLGLGLAAFLDRTGRQGQPLKLAWMLGAWGAAVVLIQVTFPFLTEEAARLKLANAVPFLGWIYTLWPSFADRPGVWTTLLGLAVFAAAIGLVVAGMRMMKPAGSTQPQG